MNLESLINKVKRGAKKALLGITLAGALYLPSGCGGEKGDFILGDAPLFTPPFDESESVNENQPYNYVVDVFDPQNDPVNLVANNVPVWATWDAGTNTLSGTPGYSDSGVYTTTFTADDGLGHSNTKDLEIIVINVNREPVITPIGALTKNEGDVFEVEFLVTDPDGDSPIDFWINNAPFDSQFDSGTMTFSWPTNYSDAGTHTLNLVADDRNGGVTNQPTDLTVVDVANPDRIISVYNDGTWKLASMLGDGSDLQVINAPGDFKGRPRWYPGDNSLITYFRSDNPGVAGHDPRLANADGTGEVKIIDNPDVDKVHFSIASDKTTASYVSDEPSYGKVYLADWNDATKTASNIRTLNSNTNVESWPEIAGQWVYYTANKSGNWEVCRFRKDQTGLEENLTNNMADDFFEGISLDGTKMLMSSNRNGSVKRLYTSDIDGSNVTQITNNSIDLNTGDFSPDGNWVVYALNGDLYKIRTDGKFNQMISDGSDSYYDPDW